MEARDWVTVIAVVAGPIVAVQISVYLQNRRERRQRRLGLFKTLMATRASSLAPEHVQALNLIDVEFDSGSSAHREVRDAWKIYLDHLNSASSSPEAWAARREDLLVELLYRMATSLGYGFDKTYLRRSAYFPTGHGAVEVEQAAIRRGMAGLLGGQRSLRVSIESVGEAAPVARGAAAEREPGKDA